MPNKVQTYSSSCTQQVINRWFLFTCLLFFEVLFENTSLIWRSHHYQWRVQNLHLQLLSRKGSLSCNICWPMGHGVKVFAVSFKRTAPISPPFIKSKGYWWTILALIPNALDEDDDHKIHNPIYKGNYQTGFVWFQPCNWRIHKIHKQYMYMLCKGTDSSIGFSSNDDHV